MDFKMNGELGNISHKIYIEIINGCLFDLIISLNFNKEE